MTNSEELRQLRAEIERLSARLSALETAEPVPPPVAVAQEEAISEELVLVLSAAIAAFLGKKPHIRQIRLIKSGAWAQQGRVTIQASHMLAMSRP